MSKQTFLSELNEYLSGGGKLSFLFGDISIPITYLDSLGVFAIESPDYPLTMKIDYSLDFAENANNLMEKLLKEYPELEE